MINVLKINCGLLPIVLCPEGVVHEPFFKFTGNFFIVCIVLLSCCI